MIFLYVFLGLIALLLLLLCFDIYICIEYRDGLKLTTRFLGIPIDLSKIIAGSQGGDDEKGEEEKPDEKKEKKYIDGTSIKSWFLENANRYDNIRILKNKLEKAVYDSLAEHFIIEKA